MYCNSYIRIYSIQVYPISKPVRGRAVIINIEWYQDKDMMRPGSTIDMENLRSLFTALHFGTDVWENCDLEVGDNATFLLTAAYWFSTKNKINV